MQERRELCSGIILANSQVLLNQTAILQQSTHASSNINVCVCTGSYFF